MDFRAINWERHRLAAGVAWRRGGQGEVCVEAGALAEDEILKARQTLGITSDGQQGRRWPSAFGQVGWVGAVGKAEVNIESERIGRVAPKTDLATTGTDQRRDD